MGELPPGLLPSLRTFGQVISVTILVDDHLDGQLPFNLSSQLLLEQINQFTLFEFKLEIAQLFNYEPAWTGKSEFPETGPHLICGNVSDRWDRDLANGVVW